MNQQVINKAKQIMNKKFGAECGDTVDALRTREMAKTTEKNSKNASGKEKHFNTAEFINILTDVVVDGFDLYDNEEKAMIALES
ncbi:hypothetical protein TRFO_03841 [Tritrichomonas foetus]|uniref:Uncharacterized protein n=1 Tax=Tritrichomonas foetus TaxID=1144522 RepID=A0A1J4KL25_9EUKA|nr:hypothetical protein TRFO_03841 [Tritrichomonas foetus]|eukprot:OHT11640.1 hypothetical protein TRFO_03841 [Tritrichomonas foetus]